MYHLIEPLNYKIGDSTYEMSNLVASIVLKRLNIDRTFLFKEVIIQPDSTPEQISFDQYGTTQYWWVIVLVNHIVDPWSDLPMNNDLLVNYTKAKYGNPDDLHWFIDIRTNTVCDDRSSEEKWMQQWQNQTLPEYIVPVSHLEYEADLNIKRTRIQVVNPDYISTFEEVFKETVNED